jgi:Glycosyl transferase family 2
VSEPPVSVVVEWDNVRLAGPSRARAMLERLREELSADDRPDLEVLLVHDGRPGDVSEAQRILAPSGVDVRVVSAPGCDYYELKNAGVRAARGGLVVFVDCDILPEPGWLGALLEPFSDPGVAVVAGATYLDRGSFWGRAMALASVFEPRAETAEVVPVARFSANSLAFRRETALAFPFPEVAGSSRASCVVLAHQLAEAGVGIVASRAARAAHPAPSGVRAAFVRALVHGRDTVVLADAGAGDRVSPRAGIRRLGELLQSALRDRRRLGLSPLAVPFAAAIAVAYLGVAAAGAVLARVAPERARALDL